MDETISLGALALSAEQKRWFVEARFGMFIHWGLYALPARHEWVKNFEELADEDYRPYFENFDPDLYDPRDWARRAREAGMRYAVLTAKHHEGFCLFDTEFTDYKAGATPHGRDLVAPFVEAFRAEGLKVGFYYSLLDWHHPDFTIDGRHPLRNHPEAARLNAGRDMARYAEYMRNQVRELLTNYGKIDILFFDFSYPGFTHNGLPGKGRRDWESEKLLKLARELQPEIIVNNRLDLNDIEGFVPDFVTPEQYTPRHAPTLRGEAVTWEVCHTLSGSWGYHRDEATWKDAEQLVKLLIDTVALGGNLLMNVGPTARGTFDARANAALEVYADWMRVNARAIHGAGPSAYPAPFGCRYTQKGDRLYLHIHSWPFRHIHVDGIGDRLAYAQFVHDGSEVRWLRRDPHADGNTGVAVDDGTITLELPVRKPDVVVPVVELILKA